MVGLVVAFDTPSASGRVWRAEQFRAFAASGHPAAMCLGRHPVDPFNVPAAERFGTWRAFAIVEQTSTPAGVLALGEVEHSVKGDLLLRDLTESLNPWADAAGEWGLSAGTVDGSAAEDDTLRWIGEATLTRSPAHPTPRVIGVGSYALDVWALLTGLDAPHVVTAPAPLRRRLIGAWPDGRAIYGQE